MIGMVPRRLGGGFGHVFALLGLAIPLVARTVVDLRRGVDPDLSGSTAGSRRGRGSGGLGRRSRCRRSRRHRRGSLGRRCGWSRRSRRRRGRRSWPPARYCTNPSRHHDRNRRRACLSPWCSCHPCIPRSSRQAPARSPSPLSASPARSLSTVIKILIALSTVWVTPLHFVASPAGMPRSMPEDPPCSNPEPCPMGFESERGA